MEDLTKPKKKKHLLYSLFNPQGNGKGVQKLPEGPDNISKGFKILGRNITNMFYLNLLFVFGNFPIFFALYNFSGNVGIKTTAAASSLYGPLYGIMQVGERSPVTEALFGVHGVQAFTTVSNTWTYVLYGLALLTFFTFGFTNTGVAYIMRSIVRGQPISIISDFFGAIKKNIKQALIIGILDLGIILLFCYNLTFFNLNGGSTLFLSNLIILCFFVMMRYYIYLIMITFDLSIWKIIKNSMFFIMLGFKRNIMAFLGGLLMILIEWIILAFIPPIGIIFPFVLFFSVPTFFGVYAAYPMIKKIMIDPQYASAPADNTTDIQ